MNERGGIFDLDAIGLDSSMVASPGDYQRPVDDDGADEPVEPAEAEKGAKKRSRPKRVAPEIAGTGVVVLGDRFVCSYSGEFGESAVFIPGVDTACFRNLPCAFAFLEDSGAKEETVQKYKQALCEAYEQQINTVERAPKRELLANFGGDRYYGEWIGNLHFWDRLTESGGLTVPQYLAKKKKGNGTATKRGKGSGARVSFDAAPYTIAYGKGPAGCKLINALDGVSVDEDVDVKKTMSMVRAMRKLQTFCSAHSDFGFEVRSVTGDGFYAFFIAIKDDKLMAVSVPAKFQNHIAQQLLGHSAFGPATFIFTRKYSQRI
jgi:hypothetical protein